mmetsp:Transcript_86463/g.222712  ORF Transcript_86463/g.222712 Transcript_86463/m.222712 type:complete len:215 (-) Transcript_86463:1859-2503(-)
MRGWSASASSSLETRTSCDTKCTTAPELRLVERLKSSSICPLSICDTIDSELTSSTCRSSAPSATNAETPRPWALRFRTCVPEVLPCAALLMALAVASSSPWKNWKSCRTFWPMMHMRSSCEMQCSTYCQEGPRLLPSDRPMASKALMHSMFFCFISFTVVRYVNLARDETKASRSVSMSKRAAILMQCLKPSMHSSTLAALSCISNSTASVAR